MIYIEVNFSMFCDQFHRTGRETQFTYEGKKTLWRYLEGLHGDNDRSWELDVIELCCDWSEYNLKDLAGDYRQHDDETDEEVLTRVKDRTIVLETEGDTYVIASF